MRIAAPRRFLALVAVAVVAACGSSSESTAPPPVPTGSSYVVSMSGDVRASLEGVPTALKSSSGYSEIDASGQLQSTPVVLIQFTAADPTQPRLAVGLLGPIQPGTYTVRTPALAVGLGSRSEAYGVITQAGSDGTRSFNATSGTVTLAAVGDTLRGTLMLHYGTVAFFPPNSSKSAPITGASVDATATFVVAAPKATVP